MCSVQKLSRQTFNQVQLDRNRQYYRLLMSVCRLIYEQLLIDESTGHHRFEELHGKNLATLFEHFVVEFYRSEQDQFQVNPTKKINGFIRGRHLNN